MIEVRPFSAGDETAICDIYNYYIANTVITFEEELLSPESMRERIESYSAHYPWFVAVSDGEVVGYSYASKFHSRSAYRFTAESTVYVRNGFHRRGYGKALYKPILEYLAVHGCHVVLAAIALPNEGSVRLHESLGFTKVGHFSQVGRKFNQWIDVGYWQIVAAGKGSSNCRFNADANISHRFAILMADVGTFRPAAPVNLGVRQIT